MKRLIAIFGYLAYIFLGITMLTTARAELSSPENAGAFAEKFGIEIEAAVLGILCTVLIIYIIVAAIALLIKMSHAASGFGFFGALNMLFDVVFCIVHGAILYSLVTSDASKSTVTYLAVLFGISIFALFSNGASLSRPAGKK